MTEQAITTNSNMDNIVREVRRDPFIPDSVDSLLAIVTFFLGFLFIRWVLFSWQGWGVSLFTAMFGGLVTLYLRHKGIRMPRTAWFATLC